MTALRVLQVLKTDANPSPRPQRPFVRRRTWCDRCGVGSGRRKWQSWCIGGYRAALARVQTPQAFHRDLLERPLAAPPDHAVAAAGLADLGRGAVKDRLGFEGFPGRDAWVTVEASAPEQVRRMILSSLQQTRQTPPTLQLYLMQAPEVKVAGIMGAFTLIMMFGPSGSTAFTVPVLSFLLGVVLRRVRQGVDNALVWPLVENLIVWTMVNSLAGGRYERAEFN